METNRAFRMRSAVWVIALLSFSLGPVIASDQETPAQVGEQVAVEGTFVRVAANDEGWVVVGYRVANESVGEEWMLLEVGLSLTEDSKVQTVTRDDIKLVTPDDTVISLPTQEDFEKVRGNLVALVKRAAMISEPIDYFPRSANQPCTLRFFAGPTAPRPMKSYDQVDLTSQTACVGYLYFQVPGGIKIGTYNLDVKFDNSIVKVPLEMMTKERQEQFQKEWKDALKKEREQKKD